MATFLYRALHREVAMTVVVPADGSPVTVPAGSAFVADLGSVSVEGGPGVFLQDAEVSVSHTPQGAGQHSRFEMAAAQPVLLDFGGAQPAGPLTLRFETDRVGLKAAHATPAVWDGEIGAWVPTIDEVTVSGGEIVVRTVAGASTSWAGPEGAGGVTVSAEHFGPVAAALPSPCSLPWWSRGLVLSWGCGAKKVVTVFVPAAWRTTQDAARGLLGGVVDVARLSADAVVSRAREYLPKVMRLIEAGVAAGLEAGIAFYEHWLLPALGAIFELRASPPACNAGTPQWLGDGIDFSDSGQRDPRVHLCTQATRGDDLHVKTVNNRNFGFQITPRGGDSLENFTAQEPAHISVASLLTNKANRFLVDNVLALGGYQWPLSAASFDIEEFTPEDRSQWTAQWLINGHTAMLDAIRMGGALLSRAADHVPFGLVVLDAAECTTPVVGAVEQSTHWIGMLNTAGSCLSTAANAVGLTVVGIPVSAVLEFGAQVLESITTAAITIRNRITVAEFLAELARQPATLTVTPGDDATEGNGNFIAVGDGHSCAIGSDNTIDCWGNNFAGQLDAPGGTYKAIAVGYAHSCAIGSDDTIDCWGHNGYGQLNAPSGTYKALAARHDSSCAIRSDSTIDCWGNNDYGQLNAPGGTYKAITVGDVHSCAIRGNNTIVCWGLNDFRQLDVPSGTYRALAAGHYYTCAIRSDSTIACWGGNGFVQDSVPSGTYKAIAAGGDHSCAIRRDNTIRCWGYDHSGVLDVPSGTFRAVAAGDIRTCAMRGDYSIRCWGRLPG